MEPAASQAVRRGPDPLRKLYRTLFLRGRSSRNLQKSTVPKSFASKLWTILLTYALTGLVALIFHRQPVFALSVYLHGLTFAIMGLFVAASVGEVLFNKEEADILLHRPVSPRKLLWAKISVMIEVSLYMSAAFNLAGFFIGTLAPDGGWRFPIAHALSTVLQTLFGVSAVVLGYQLCLKWFGRERLDGFVTTAQILVAVAAVAGAQLSPYLVRLVESDSSLMNGAWWLALMPFAWFAGLDNALCGNGSPSTWLLAGIGVAATVVVTGTAFGRLTQVYESGLQRMSETTAPESKPRKAGGRGRVLRALANFPPMKLLLRDSISRASFLLTAAYLVRDRDLKLRLYPGMAPMMVVPFIFLLRDAGPAGQAGMSTAPFGIAFAGAYLGLIPMMALNLVQFSQQWQAADLFRAAPLRGPASLARGARYAALIILTLPILLVFVAVELLVRKDASMLFLLLPGLITLPLYSLLPFLIVRAAPLSMPTEEARTAKRSFVMIGIMFSSFLISMIAMAAWEGHWFWWLVLGEVAAVAILHGVLSFVVSRMPWQSME